MAERARCEICNREFKNAEGLAHHNKDKHPIIPQEKKSLPVKKIRNWVIFIFIIGLIIFGIYSLKASVKNFPPIDAEGHIELNPDSHILKEQMTIEVQKHMLEHSDGNGRPGVIINYNCKNYKCEPGLIQSLESFALEYNYVYVAPFGGMSAKIVLTKLGGREILNEFDNKTITDFINS